MMHCLIVEDEPLAADVLLEYVKRVPFLELKGTCAHAIEALEVMQHEKIDVIFLDIHLPGLKGLEFIRTLKDPPAIILTTAYHQYALEGYEFSVVDYLLKPIGFNRFLEAVNKLKRISSEKQKTISIQAEKKTIIIPVDDIVFIEAQKEYVRIQTSKNSYLTKYALTKMEEELDPSLFIRIHRSFIVSISKLTAFTGHDVELNGKSIPIGGNYKDQVAERLKSIFK